MTLIDPDSLLDAVGEVLADLVILGLVDFETLCDAEAEMLGESDSLLEADGEVLSDPV